MALPLPDPGTYNYLELAFARGQAGTAPIIALASHVFRECAFAHQVDLYLQLRQSGNAWIFYMRSSLQMLSHPDILPILPDFPQAKIDAAKAALNQHMQTLRNIADDIRAWHWQLGAREKEMIEQRAEAIEE